MFFSNVKPTPATSAIATALEKLQEGDILTNFDEGNREARILVLERDSIAETLVLSRPSDKLSIVRHPMVFRWDNVQQRIVDDDGNPHACIGHYVEVLTGQDEGLRAVALYKSLSRYKDLRLKLTEAGFQRFFRDEPNIPMVLDALIADEGLDSLAKVETCMNYVFGGRRESVSRREMALLCMAITRIVSHAPSVRVLVVSENDFQNFVGDTPPRSKFN